MSGTDINRAASNASSTARDMADKASSTIHDMAGKATETASELGSKAKEYGQGLQQQIEHQPMTSVMVAAGVAFVAGVVTACLASSSGRSNGRG